MTDHDHAPGAPWGDEAADRLLPVYCVHGVKWEPEQAGYVPQTVDLLLQSASPEESP
jgi:hypothetical protein